MTLKMMGAAHCGAQPEMVVHRTLLRGVGRLRALGLSFTSTLLLGSALTAPAFAQSTSPTGATDGARAAPAIAARGVQNILVRDSFAIGSADGALCQVQSELRDPALASMFDRAWTIVCRDAAQSVGRVYALRGADGLARVAARPGAPACPTPASLGAAPAIVDCTGLLAGLPGRRHSARANGTTFVAEGLAAYDDALRIALASVMAQRAAPGTIRVATTSVGDADALARVQVATLPADRALAEGYRRNNSGDYAEAAIYFEALERRPADPDGALDPSEFTLNRALQLSNMGDFGESDRLLDAVDAVPTADAVQLRLRRNFRAMHALNQRDFDGALALLAQPLTPIAPISATVGQDVAITAPLARAINSDAGARVLNQSGDDERLTTQERAIILDAQALQLTGTILRLTGDTAGARVALTRSINQALAVRDGRVISIIRLRAQMIGEIGLLDEAEGRTGDAEGRLQAAIQLLETEYPETMALAGARAKYAAFLTRHDRADDALIMYRQVISALTLQRRQLTGLYNQMAPYYRMLVERQAVDPAATGEFFAAVQLLVRPGVADTQAVLARELSGGSGEAAGMFRQANTLARDLERARIDYARLSAQPDNPAAPSLQAELQVRIENLGAQQTATLTQLAQFPQYRAIEQDALTLPQLQSALVAGEAYVKLTVIGDKVYALLATQGTARAWQTGIDRNTLEASVDQIRDSISVYQGGQYNTFPFDAAAANQLYTALFSPVADQLGSIRHLIFEPDGAMMRLPVNLLITDAASVAAYSARASAPGGDVFDMRGVQWLGRSTRVSTAVSALAFRNTRATAPSRAPRGYLGLGENAPVTNAASVAALRSASGVDASCSWDIGEWGKPISAAELNSARTIIGIGNADIVTGAAFTDRRVRDRSDLNTYRILHFATHGFVTAPRDDCPTKPSLLTSFDSAESDGLLSFDEIFALRIDADLVILSACDTAGQASVSATRAAGITTGGGSALDGLVRAFIGAGGRSVLASHWPAPDDFQATERLITGLFHASPGTSIADALGQAQDVLMAEAATSHPYYWAGFAIIGDGSRALIPATTMAATPPATPMAGQ